MVAESGADIRALRVHTKEECHVWKPMPETAQMDLSQPNGYSAGVVGNTGNWPTGREGTSHKIVHMNNFTINNFRRLNAARVMALLPGVGNNYDHSEIAGQTMYFFGKCTHKIILRNMEKQHQNLRISKMQCTRNLDSSFQTRDFTGTALAGHNLENVEPLFVATGTTGANTKSIEHLLWTNWSSYQDQDDSAVDRGEHWLNPNTNCAFHPAVTTHFKCRRTQTIRVAPGQSVEIKYTLPAKLVKYNTLLNNACLKGDIAFLLESWGDIGILKKTVTIDVYTTPADHLKRPVNMDFDKETLTMPAAPGIDYTAAAYEESRQGVVRDHGEWAILHETKIPVQHIKQKHEKTIRRNEYLDYKHDLALGVYNKVFAPQDNDMKEDIAQN